MNGVIREGTVVFLSGKEGTDKSFIALELASCIAEQRDFYGHAVGTGEVVYVAAERGNHQLEHLEALFSGIKSSHLVLQNQLWSCRHSRP